jgi:putative DNA primase/helicase
MEKAPEGYKPWFFKCGKDSKNPDVRPCKSWHDEEARLSKEQCIQAIQQGYNLGISARKDDQLIIGDIDEPELLAQLPKVTLTTTSRKRVGAHFFGWNKDGTGKINLPTDDGEIRSDNQYVLAPGSYVPFNLNDKKDKEAFNKLPEEIKQDKLLGYYTVKDCIIPRELSFTDFPKFFQDKQNENLEAEAVVKQREEVRSYPEGKYSELFKLRVSDIVGLIPSNERHGHPLHDSDTDSNFSLSKDGSIAHCWRHLVSLNAVQYLCVRAGYCSCVDAGTPHKGRGISKIRGDKLALEVAYQEAVKLKLIKEHKKKKAGTAFTMQGQAEQFENIQPLFYDKHGMWWLWNSNEFKWEIVDEVDILNMIAEDTGEDIISPKNRTLILNSLKQEGRKHIPQPIKPTWIQFKNEIFDVMTGERFEATAKYFVTNPIPYNLHKDNLEATPVMDKIFEEWVGKEYTRTLYEILAYSMIPDYPINRLFCFIGAGMNGKSKFLELLRKFIGGENCCTTELDTLLISRFEITRLHKKLVCMMGETNFNEISKTSILKKLTGGDLIGFEYKNKNPFDEQNYAKILIATNNLPSTTDKTMGFYRRWMIIDFPNQFSEAKDILNDIPEDEYECLALKCCSILKDLLINRKFTNEGTVDERMEKYEAKSNFLEKFIKETTKEDFDGYITKNEFFKKFGEWSKEHKHREMSEVSIGLAMKKLGIESDRKYFEWLFDGKGGQLRCWVGIKWKD